VRFTNSNTNNPTVGVTSSAFPTLTITKTATPSMPMIEVGGLQVPDPKVSNPELFYISSPDSPIVQYANAFSVNLRMLLPDYNLI